MPASLIRNLVLALIYGFIGWAALQIAVPPGYAAPLFPPAGIALAALLTYGYGMVPGVLAGSLAVQFMAAANAGSSGFSWTQALLAAAGPTLQAVAGTWLTRRLVKPPFTFESTRSILCLVGVVAPLSCLIAASLSVPRLASSGVIPADDLAFSWWNWWIGDTLGVVTVTPLALTLVGQPRSVWAPRLRTVALPLAVALLLVAAAFVQMREWERIRLEAQFTSHAESIGSLLEKRLDVQTDLILAMERFVSASENVTASEWQEFVSPWLERYPGTLNFAWAPLVHGANRAAFETWARRTVMPDFQILDRSLEGRTFPARRAEEYLPLLYVEPLAPNLKAVGLNPLSLPASREALERSARTGQPAATAAVLLVQAQKIGVVLHQVVLRKAPSENPKDWRGAVSSVFIMDDAMAATLAGLPDTGMDVCMIDLAGATDGRHLSGPRGCEDPAWRSLSQHIALPYSFGGRPWEIVLRASDAYRAANRSWAVWSTLAVGLTCVGLLGTFLLINSGRTRRINELVVERTAELAAANDRLRDQREALAEAQRMARMGSWSLLEDGEHIECSDELRRVMDLPQSKHLKLGDLSGGLAAPDRSRLAEALELARRRPASSNLDAHVDLRQGGQEILHFHIESSHGPESGQPRLRGTVQSVTAVRQAEAHIHFLARFDSLTGLPNRLNWLEHARATLVEANRHGDPVAVLFLDLDHFKTVNDSLGHAVGDRLLASVVTRLANCLREEDLLARLGGDEFVVLISRFKQREDVARVAIKLIESLKGAIPVDQHELSVSASIGIALFPDDGQDVDTLLKNADMAMYGAKQAGRNAYHFFERQMDERAVQRLQLEHALRRGIERQELILYYQPQLNLADASPGGCEALVRWQHPERGLVMPDEFIPIAEESGLIHALGDWVLAEACRRQAELSAQGIRLAIGVNISALQFRRPDFADRVIQILGDSGADPHLIELEITESALMQPDEAMLGRLERIRQLGITLALDDFGTGYSSLAYLRRLPIQRLKIDRSFVRDLPGDPEDAAIASATLSLARDLGLKVVAEGVETAEQRNYLAERGCHLIQGYLVARPMPMENLVKWLEGMPRATA